MKKAILVVLLGLVMALGISLNSQLFAVEIGSTNVAVDVAQIFTIQFYPRAAIDDTGTGFVDNIRYHDGQIDFPPITEAMLADPLNNAMVYTGNWVDGDDKSDVGILCISNTGNPWNLKIHMENTDLTRDNFVVYIPEFAYYRNAATETHANTIVAPNRWVRMPDTPQGIFETTDHMNNAPWGTLLTLSFAVVPSGSLTLDDSTVVCNGDPIDAGSHNVTVKYTMSPGTL